MSHTIKIFMTAILVGCFFNSSYGQSNKNSQRIPLGKNAYIEPFEKANSYGRVDTNEGVAAWTNTRSRIKVYFLATKTGTLNLSLMAKSGPSQCKLRVTCADEDFTVDVDSSRKFVEVPVGTVEIKNVGYQMVIIKGLKKSGGAYFPGLKEFIVSGPAARGVRYNTSKFRSIPSTHLKYETPKGIDFDTFYSELTIPTGADPIHSYYVANGFYGGYFGIQVNSKTERRVLFSVWSTFSTNDPKKIPKDQRVLLIEKGPDVVTNDFGNEGSGGQSFLRFNWKPDVTYKFLVHTKRNDQQRFNTYTAQFYDPDQQYAPISQRKSAQNNRIKINSLRPCFAIRRNFTEELTLTR